jgi:hypothetical protein
MAENKVEPPVVVVDGFWLLLPSLVMTFQLVGTWREKTLDVYCVNVGFSFSPLGATATAAAAKAGAVIHAVLTPTPTTRDWNKARLPTSSTSTGKDDDDDDNDDDEALLRVGALLLPSYPPPKPKVHAEETTTRRAKIRKVPSIFIISLFVWT